MKFLLATKDGYKPATDAVPVKFTNPPWLAQYDFFVARTLGDPPDYAPGDHFRLTEASTGYGVNESLGDTRTQAAKLGKATLAFVGPEKFALAIARAPKISQEAK